MPLSSAFSFRVSSKGGFSSAEPPVVRRGRADAGAGPADLLLSEAPAWAKPASGSVVGFGSPTAGGHIGRIASKVCLCTGRLTSVAANRRATGRSFADVDGAKRWRTPARPGSMAQRRRHSGIAEAGHGDGSATSIHLVLGQ